MSARTYIRRVKLPVSAEDAFRWHERPGALERLIPPWEWVQVDLQTGGVRDGARVELRNRIGPLPVRWIAEHHGYEVNRQFRDTQLSGPFKRWEHTHRFQDDEDGLGVLVDEIEYQPPGGSLGQLLGGRFIEQKIDRMFEYRHNVTVADLAAHARYKGQGTIRVAVTGSHGLVGQTLVPMLTTGGHQVTRMVRSEATEDDVRWNPMSGQLELERLEGVDAVVHLAGENIAGSRWNAKTKQRIRDSRVVGTRTLSDALARMTTPPKVLVTASAIGFYGDRRDEILTEESSRGTGFLADVVRDWEAATQSAKDAGIRVVHLRFGVVLSPRGGALAKMLTPFKLGVGGRVGNGRQWWSWIAIDDAAGAILHAIMTESLRGPVNAVAPAPETNAEFTSVLGQVLHRPAVIPMPASAARLALGEMGQELLLASTRVEPHTLLDSRYAFRHSDLENALRHLLGK